MHTFVSAHEVPAARGTQIRLAHCLHPPVQFASVTHCGVAVKSMVQLSVSPLLGLRVNATFEPGAPPSDVTFGYAPVL